MKMISVRSVNISQKKGTVKLPVNEIVIKDQGIMGDAHAGNWQRQVSLLDVENIIRFEKFSKRKINFGEFAENITTEGMELTLLAPLDRLHINDVILEVTQIGKECHGDSCAIFREVGSCIMPKEGIFGRVVKPGIVRPGDEVEYRPKIFKTVIVTLSDRASRGEYADLSGPALQEALSAFFDKQGMKHNFRPVVIPDDPAGLESILLSAREESADFVFTTGGTGIGPRDFTPDVVRKCLDREIPGIMEMIRTYYGADKPNALLSRGVAGVMGETLVYTLPGSVRAVREYMTEILKTLKHTVYMLHGLDIHS
jgi:molybdenum cofactor synthesis domain-containing protein